MTLITLRKLLRTGLWHGRRRAATATATALVVAGIGIGIAVGGGYPDLPADAATATTTTATPNAPTTTGAAREQDAAGSTPLTPATGSDTGWGPNPGIGLEGLWYSTPTTTAAAPVASMPAPVDPAEPTGTTPNRQPAQPAGPRTPTTTPTTTSGGTGAGWYVTCPDGRQLPVSTLTPDAAAAACGPAATVPATVPVTTTPKPYVLTCLSGHKITFPSRPSDDEAIAACDPYDRPTTTTIARPSVTNLTANIQSCDGTTATVTLTSTWDDGKTFTVTTTLPVDTYWHRVATGPGGTRNVGVTILNCRSYHLAG
jgi:hypothetical protein